MTRRVSLAELGTADILLRPAEAVALVLEVSRRRECGELRGVPPPGIVRLTADGDILIEGPVTTGGDVARAAQLLNSLLAPFDAVPEYRASGALRLVIARALNTLDLPPYASLADFGAALERFATQEARTVARDLFMAWDRAHASERLRTRAPESLTISDIRRARRATGMSLADLAEIAGVPAVQLRNLEWGYMRDWRADEGGRSRVVRYARAAGLDEQLVLSIAWPMIEQAATAGPVVVTQELVPAGERRVVPLPLRPARARLFRRAGWIAAVVAILVLAIALATGLPWRAPSAPVHSARVEAVVSPPAEMAVPEPVEPEARVVPAVRHESARPPREPRRRPAQARGKRTPSKGTSFFDREVIRLVFR